MVVLVGLPRLPVPAPGSAEVETAGPVASRTTLWLLIAGIADLASARSAASASRTA